MESDQLSGRAGRYAILLQMSDPAVVNAVAAELLEDALRRTERQPSSGGSLVAYLAQPELTELLVAAVKKGSVTLPAAVKYADIVERREASAQERRGVAALTM